MFIILFLFRVPGSNWALEQAKHNLIHKYFLVGVTEEMGDFVAMLDYSLPRIFKGAYDLYLSGKVTNLASFCFHSDDNMLILKVNNILYLM